ncbi:MAG: NAD(+)/NADH kinase [Clostridia bacterium]|nr:NAD(+)/NADH kinase [Clostridia bacterium]
MNKTYAIISNKEKDKNRIVSKQICKLLNTANSCEIYNVAVGKDDQIDTEKLKNVDIIFSLGGDGTFLNIARQTSKLGIPILGINLGSLGFLSEVEMKDLDQSINQIVRGEYKVTDRMMIDAVIIKNDKEIYRDNALNDFVISRGELSRIITLELYIDHSFVDSFPGDGLIISTPTGSTGYALSAGGPVIEHGANLMLVTPICSHVMHSRSFVVSKDAEIEIIVKGDQNSVCLMTIDGQKSFVLEGNEKIEIKKSKLKAKLVKVNNKSFYDTLRKKMYNRER